MNTALIIATVAMAILIVWNLLLIYLNEKDSAFDGFERNNFYHWVAVNCGIVFIVVVLMQTRLFGSY